MRTNVYVDGFNLYYGCLKDSPYKWLDLEALCRRLLPKHQIGRIRYFTAHVSGRGDAQGPARQQAYLRALRTSSKVTVHRGHFLTKPTRMILASPPAGGPRTVEVLKTEEKGSDVNLATCLLVDAFRKDAEAYVVITNDSDLKEPIRIVQHELGCAVGVINPHSPRMRSRALLSCKPAFFKQIRRSALARSQFPATLADGRGKITKPRAW
ncbi:MAG: NYN domain-containing protein [Micromonosporaceae bacterium]